MIARADNPNLAILEIAVQALGELTDSLVFVGGCATGLLVTSIRAHQIRPTEDVDVVTQVATISEYHSVEAQLTSRGFKHDTSPDAPICRWLSTGVTLDLMPSQPGVLSFHNRWYPRRHHSHSDTASQRPFDKADLRPALPRDEAGSIQRPRK